LGEVGDQNKMIEFLLGLFFIHELLYKIKKDKQIKEKKK